MPILLLASLAGCTIGPTAKDVDAREDRLRANLTVAAAALSAGQPEVARRQYQSLAARLPRAPEPLLGLGHIAFGADDHEGAERYFVKAASLAENAPSIRTEALLGAGRAALARGRADSARRYLARAREIARDLPMAPWVANGFAVAAALDGDLDAAEAGFDDALRLSSDHPRIAANYVRMLVAAGRHDRAARIFAEREPSFWLDDDAAALRRLIEESGRDPRGRIRMLVFAPGPDPADAARADRRGWDPAAGPVPALRLAIRAGGAAPADAPGPDGGPAAVADADADTGAAPPSSVLSLSPGQSARLDLDDDATSVLVAAPEVADVQLLSPRVLYIIAKGLGRTSVTVVSADGRVRDRKVWVGLDLGPIHAMIEGQPELQGVRARHVANGVGLTGEVASAAAAQRALRLTAAALPKGTLVENQIRVSGPQQVNLEVQIAEVQRSVSEELGINWEAIGRVGAGEIGFRIGRIPVVGDEYQIGAFDGQISPGLVFDHGTADSRVTGVVDALAQAGLANVLARPNVTAISGESASFFSGGEYPLPTGFDDGVIVFEYKKFGVLLDFVPTVIDSGRIVLHVRPEVSEPSLNQSVQIVGVSIPVINVRRAETTVEVANGESIVIGGLFRNSSNTREAGLPLLKDVPGLGTIFGHRSTRQSELELIVIVTARLVQPGEPRDRARARSARRSQGYHY